MNALISGSAGIALIVDKHSLSSIHIDDTTKIIPRQSADIPFLLGECTNPIVLESVTHQDVIQHLEIAVEVEESITLFLILLDSALSTDVRREAATVLDDMLKKSYVTEQLECLFYARELPESVDIQIAFACCQEIKSKLTRSFLQRLIKLQPYIVAVRRQWDAIPIAYFGTNEEKDHIRNLFIKEGLFRNLTQTISLEGNVDEYLLENLLKPSINTLPNIRNILLQWCKPFRGGESTIVIQPHKTDEEQLTKKHDKKKHFSGDEVLENVQHQKEAIVTAMNAYNVRKVHKYTEDLIGYQMKHGGAKYACKSLCDLAMEAKELHLYDIQLEFTKMSTELNQKDGRCWAHYADALLCTNQPIAALKIYESIQNSGEYRIAPSGRATVLKSLNRLDEALDAYDKVIAEFPYDIVAKNGRAEVLKALNRLDEALDAYDKIIAEFPYDIVAKNGRAGVLKALNRLDDALGAYSDIVTEHPYDIVAKNGRAEVLKALNRLDDALGAYNDVITEHPYDVVTKNGRAEVLKTLNRLDEALEAYDKIITEHPYNIVAKHGRAEVLKALGRLDDALSAFNDIITEYPYDIMAKHGRAEVLKDLNRLDDTIDAYDKIIDEYPYDVFSRIGKASVLGAMKRWEEALELLPEKNLVTPDDWVAYHIRGMILLHQGDLKSAINIFEEGVRNNPRPADREYFQTALATAHLRKKDYKGASNLLENISTPTLQTPVNILRIHTLGQQGYCDRTVEIFKSLPSNPSPLLAELQNELYTQFVAYQTPKHNEEWLIEEEIKYLLLAKAA